MALTTNFNVDPYYDDFDDDKNYYRVLFKPGNAVQARELTQLQTTLQDQIKKFGDHMFKTGSIVTGGQISISNTEYINIASTYAGEDISYLNFEKQMIRNVTNTKRAYVLKAYDADQELNQPATLIINQLYGDNFTSDETIYTQNTTPGGISYYANTTPTTPTGLSQAFSINEGVFYYDGLFIKTQPQSVAVNKYNRTGSAIIGFNVEESLIDYTEDTSLLDPAQSSSNFQAPGADRYKVQMVLDTRDPDSTDLEKFVELGVIENGIPKKIVQTPLYGPILDELARRTYDESGNYIIKNFNIELTDSTANSAFSNITLNSGKGYIRGYQFETTSPTTLTVPKPRTTKSVSNKSLDVDYGYYVFANGMFGNFATNQYGNAEISLLNTEQANNYLFRGSAGGGSLVYANTVIGNVRVKLVNFYSVSGVTTDSNNYIYKVFLTEANTRSLGPFRALTGGSTTTVKFPTGLAANNDVYKGLIITMTAGTTDPADNTARIITAYDGSTRTATVDPEYQTAPDVNHFFKLETDFTSAESLITRNTSSFRVASANISPLSKDESVGKPPKDISETGGLFQPAFIKDSNREPLVIRIGEANISDNTIRDFTYSYKRLYQFVSFDGAGVSTALQVGTGESLQSATTEASRQKNYQIIVSQPGTSSYYRGQIVPAQNFTVSTGSRTLTLTSGAGTGMTANIYAVINASNPTSKTKRFIRANTQLVDPTATRKPNQVFSGNTSAYVAPFDGQTILSREMIRRLNGTNISLFVSDVTAINAIFDFAGSAVNTTNYNALDKDPGSSSNVTARFTLDDGQNDSYYDWSSIVLKSGQNAPQGPILVLYDRFTSNGSGFFNVDSYTRLGKEEDGGTGIDYGLIPVFRTQSGAAVPLKDYLDFRPVRSDAANIVNSSVTTDYLANNFVLSVNESVLGPQIAEPGVNIILDYQYYLGRIDRVILNKNREFEVIRGVPGITPIVPNEPADAMTLYILSYPAYLTETLATKVDTFTYRRYTMEDIRTLEKRIQNLEIYTALTFAELATINKNDRSIKDSTGLARPKNGIFVDSFVDKDGSNVILSEFNAAIDTTNRVARGSYNLKSVKLYSDKKTAKQNVVVEGPLMLLKSTSETFVKQNRSSKTMNINPFSIVNYVGRLDLDPKSDVWKDETRIETMNIDMTGGQAAKDAIEGLSATTWGDWKTTSSSTTKEILSSSTSIDAKAKNGGNWGTAAETAFEKTGVASSLNGGGGIYIYGDVTYTTTNKVKETTTLQQSRDGIYSTYKAVELTKSLGDTLVDMSVIEYMREIGILVLGTKLKPFTTVYPFFDNTKIGNKTGKLNRFSFDQNVIEFNTKLADAEEVNLYSVLASSTGTFTGKETKIGEAKVVLKSNNDVWLQGLKPDATFGANWSTLTNGIWIRGDETTKVYKATSWTHQLGEVREASVGTPGAAGAGSNVVLDYHASLATNATEYVGKTISIIRGKGAGQTRTMNAYNTITRTANVSTNWSTVPDTTSVYTIGTLETNEQGATAGVILVPKSTFRTGERVVRLIDDEDNNIENSRTNAEAPFYSQGTIEKVQEKTISVFTMEVQKQKVSEDRTQSSSSVKSVSNSVTKNNVVIGYYDPLAQTFLINVNQYPQGVVVDSIRVCFKTKDTTAPVTCQIRPVENGYPSSTVIYPYAEKTLTPDLVKITNNPDLDNAATYTQFDFDSPILLLPGEHSFVLVSNSNGYEAYVAEMGATDIRTSVKISEQPYTGSLFLSQNGSTWVAEQMMDLMFSIQKKVFTTDEGSAEFKADMSSYASDTVIPFDLMQVMATDSVMTKTSLEYDFIAETASGISQPYLNVIPNADYDFTDGFGRRLLKKSSGNNTFTLRATMSTSNKDISPMIDVTRFNLLAIENKINDLPLANSGFIITDDGNGYTGNGTVEFSYPTGTVGQGSGAAARAVMSGGQIVRIELTNPGSGYITSPIVTVNAPTGGSPITATVEYNGEDKASGGNAEIRYISKRIQLAPGFDSGDLRVYLDVYRPPNSGILVYYKLLSESDNSNFDSNRYQLMTESAETAGYFSKNKYEYFETTFAPGTYGSGVFDNKVSYTSGKNIQYDNFMIFSIKVVMYGQSTVDVPKISQLRAIALPSFSTTS